MQHHKREKEKESYTFRFYNLLICLLYKIMIQVNFYMNCLCVYNIALSRESKEKIKSIHFYLYKLYVFRLFVCKQLL
jgi:hypothetical protein